MGQLGPGVGPDNNHTYVPELVILPIDRNHPSSVWRTKPLHTQPYEIGGDRDLRPCAPAPMAPPPSVTRARGAPDKGFSSSSH